MWDDYNWDWSIVHMVSLELLPFSILVPGELQVAHIGLEGGLHDHTSGIVDVAKLKMFLFEFQNFSHARKDFSIFSCKIKLFGYLMQHKTFLYSHVI